MRDNINSLAIMRDKRRKMPAIPKVTIAIGIISKANRQIFLACDSETTDGAVKTHEARKIGVIEFANGKVLVAQAGSADFGDEVIEIMQKRAKAVEIENEETVSKLASDSLRELRGKAIEANKESPGWDPHRFFLEDYPLTLLVAFYFDGNPFMYRLNIHNDFIAKRIHNSFQAIGTGKDLAGYLLKEYNELDPDFNLVALVALSVIEKVIPNVTGCGSPTQAALATAGRTPEFEHYIVCDAALFAAEDVARAVRAIREQEEKLKPEKREQMLKTISAMWAGYNTPDVIQSLRTSLAAYDKK